MVEPDVPIGLCPFFLSNQPAEDNGLHLDLHEFLAQNRQPTDTPVVTGAPLSPTKPDGASPGYGMASGT